MDTDKITETIIGGAMKVSNALGLGFLEKVYENALCLELEKFRLGFKRNRDHPRIGRCRSDH